jgi:hypothetical protein
LVAAGALAGDDPVIGEVRAVMGALTGQPSPNLPQPWASLVSGRSRQGGPSGIVALGAVTPPVDDTNICVEALSSSGDSFEVQVTVSPDNHARGPFRASITTPRITWWAEDDRRNSYLGSIGNWAGGGDVGQGSVVYWPALDPKSKELRIMPTGSTHRAVITVPLPHWKSR